MTRKSPFHLSGTFIPNDEVNIGWRGVTVNGRPLRGWSIAPVMVLAIPGLIVGIAALAVTMVALLVALGLTAPAMLLARALAKRDQSSERSTNTPPSTATGETESNQKTRRDA